MRNWEGKWEFVQLGGGKRVDEMMVMVVVDEDCMGWVTGCGIFHV